MHTTIGTKRRRILYKVNTGDNLLLLSGEGPAAWKAAGGTSQGCLSCSVSERGPGGWIRCGDRRDGGCEEEVRHPHKYVRGKEKKRG